MVEGRVTLESNATDTKEEWSRAEQQKFTAQSIP